MSSPGRSLSNCWMVSKLSTMDSIFCVFCFTVRTQKTSPGKSFSKYAFRSSSDSRRCGGRFSSISVRPGVMSMSRSQSRARFTK